MAKFGPRISIKPRIPSGKFKLRLPRLVRPKRIESGPSIGKGMFKGLKRKSGFGKSKKIKL